MFVFCVTGPYSGIDTDTDRYVLTHVRSKQLVMVAHFLRVLLILERLLSRFNDVARVNCRDNFFRCFLPLRNVMN